MMRLEQLAAGGGDWLVPAMRRVLDEMRRDGCWGDHLVWSRRCDPDRWSSATTGQRELVDHPAFRVGA